MNNNVLATLKKLPSDARDFVNNQMAKLREERATVREKEAELAKTEEGFNNLWSKLPKFMKPGVSSGTSLGVAYVGGYADAALQASDAPKGLKNTLIPGLGFVLTAGALVIPNPDLSELAAATGRGLAIPAMANLGRETYTSLARRAEAQKLADEKAKQEKKA